MRTIPNFAGEAGATCSRSCWPLHCSKHPSLLPSIRARNMVSFGHGLHMYQTRADSVFNQCFSRGPFALRRFAGSSHLMMWGSSNIFISAVAAGSISMIAAPTSVESVSLNNVSSAGRAALASGPNPPSAAALWHRTARCVSARLLVSAGITKEDCF